MVQRGVHIKGVYQSLFLQIYPPHWWRINANHFELALTLLIIASLLYESFSSLDRMIWIIFTFTKKINLSRVIIEIQDKKFIQVALHKVKNDLNWIWTKVIFNVF